MGLVDTCDGELAGSHILITNEIGIDSVVHFQMKFISHRARDKQLVRRFFCRELGYLASFEVLLKEVQVVIGTYAFKGNP